MMKTKRLALLCLLLVVSVSSAVVVQAAGLMQGFRSIETAEINIDTSSVFLMLTVEDRQKVTDIVLMDSQIQQLLENADNYTIEVSEIFDIVDASELDISEDVFLDIFTPDNELALVPREGVAQATITINNDYGEDFGVQLVTVTVNLETEEITEKDVQPEIVRPKIVEGIVSIPELVENASKYDGVVVTVSGEVNLHDEFFDLEFELDGIVTVVYKHPPEVIDVSSIENGDTVTVTGTFVAPDTICATAVEKN